MERKLAAILAADVVGYSRLMAANEAETLNRLQSMLREVIEPQIEKYGGRVVKLMGDGLLADFSSTVNAVKCAVEVQQAISDREHSRTGDDRICLRIGINLGDVIIDGGDIFGDGVNIAARLEGLAEPNGICLSGTAFDTVDGKLDYHFEELGPQKVKNIAKPVRAYHVSLASHQIGEPGVPLKNLSLPDKPSIAVLPFANLSGDPDQDYFADGLTDDVIGQLARFRSLFVISSTSSFPYKGQTPTIDGVGQELGVAYVARGSIRKAGIRMRISVELVEVATGQQLWGERYDVEQEDVFAVQDEVASKIVSTLAGQVEDTDRLRARVKRTNDLAAYELVLLGEHSERQFTKDGVLKARALFQKAIQRDPDNARAHASMARTYLDELWADWTMDRDAAAEQAFDWAQKAVALDALDNRARTNLGVAYQVCKGNFDAAQVQFAKALELNPNDADAYCLKGWCHLYAGEGGQAIACTNQSMRLSPFDTYYCHLAQFFAHYAACRYEEALASLGCISDLAYPIHAFRAACCAQLGRDADAGNAMGDYMAAAKDEIAIWPGENTKAWHRHWAQSLPFRELTDLEHLLDGFRKAGMPV